VSDRFSSEDEDRERIRQCEALREYAIAEEIREILVEEQEHQIDLATALGASVPGVEEHHEKTSKA
jgi:bacterioferritin